MGENRNRLKVTEQADSQKPATVNKKYRKKTRKPKNGKTGNRKKESDPRVRITFGVLLILLSLFFLLSFITYILEYNLTGELGETIGKYLTELSFGIGSVYLIFLLLLSGLNLSFKGPKIKTWTLCKYTMIFLLWVPLFFALIFNHGGTYDRFYGILGLKFYEFLEPYISKIGIFIILIFTLFIYIIYTFNIKFNFLKKKKEKKIIDENTEDENPENKTDGKDSFSDESEFEEENNEKSGEEDDEEKKNNEEENDSIIEESPVEDEGFEDVSIPKEKDPDHIDMEITKPAEDKQAIEIGEHFGLDTYFDPKLELSDYKFPTMDLFKNYTDNIAIVDKEELEANKKRIVDTLANYSITIDKIKATIGPTVTLYEIIPAAGVRISKIKGLQDDIALCLSAIGIRIIAPIPGKGTVGIEVPNQKPQIVSMRSILGSERFQKCGYELPLGIGKTIANESYVVDLAKMPHILMAGATGQGKSVGINAIIASLLYSKHPAELKFVLIDPKKVELSLYKKIERHYLAKLPDSEDAIITDVRKVVRTLNSLCIEMDNRYELLKDAQVRNIKEYNTKFIARRLNPNEGHHFMPYIVLIADEFADLITTAGREVETPITRLAQLARAIGIHLIIATQRPSVNIITGTIKANFPARIAFRVISRVDSSTILDSNGAEQLVGRGDMLLSTGNDLVRLQCPFVDTPEVEAITDFIGSQRAYPDAYTLPDCPDEKDENNKETALDPNERDPLFEDAARIIVQSQQGSTSMLQRKLKLGYNRAGRIIDQLEKAGIVGPFMGSRQREVKVANEIALEQFLKDLDLNINNEKNYF